MNNILVVGTGTIGEPLIGLLTEVKDDLGIDDVYFYKRTPLKDEIAKVDGLCRRGAKLVVTDDSARLDFENLGHKVTANFVDAVSMSDVIIDCTPVGNKNKELFYNEVISNDKTFIAQGSEKGFGMPYAYGINDNALLDNNSPFIQVVSCNTHNIACLVDTLSSLGKINNGDFVCIRRANDVSQESGFIPSPSVSGHDCEHGTHHATDVVDLLATRGYQMSNRLFSSALKINSQYMHVIRFNITLEGVHSYNEVLQNFQDNKFVALTHRKSVNRVFSFGRDHGFYGRIYNQTVIPTYSLNVTQRQNQTYVTGFCFTPQDGNSLLSSTAAALFGLHGKDYKERMKLFDKMLFDLI